MAYNDSGQSNNRTPSHDAELDQLDRFGATRDEQDKADELIKEGWWGGRLYSWNSNRRQKAREQYNSGKANITGEGFDWAAWRRDGGGRDSPKSGGNSGTDTGDGGSEQTGEPDTDTNADLGEGGGGGDD